LGRPDEAVAEQRRAQELDPLSLVINSSLGDTLFYARRYDEAIVQCRKAIEIDPNFAVPYMQLGWCYTMKEMYSEAIAEHQKAVALSNGGNRELASLAHTLAKSGKRIEARKILEQLNEKQKRGYVDRGHFASIYFALGEKEKALASLEKAYQDKSSALPYIKVNPAYDHEFRSDPRFRELVRKVGFP
jgi:tetratricopeptide (TPR) repeat protein